MSNEPTNKQPTRFAFLLVNDFTLMSMSAAIEPLRMANRLSGDSVYTWTIISESGDAVRASNGVSINVDRSIEAAQIAGNVDAVIVCGGWNIAQNTTETVLRWLRGISQSEVSLGSTCTGSYVLAAAGLLDGYRCSVHWENISSLADQFPRVHVSRNVFTIDNDRFTCSGGTSPVDMMLYFITRRCGPEVSAGVAEQFIYERVRHSSDQQRVPLRHVVGRQSEKLVIAVELMEANIREPMSQEDIAAYTGISRRQLQRLFQRYLLCTPSQHYQLIRLQRARELLHQTSISLVEIATMTGFVSSSHFSKRFKDHFGCSPRAERQTGLGSRALQ